MSSTFESPDEPEWPDEEPGPSDVPTDDGHKTGEEDAERNREEEPPA
jgi:hypothetical protein